jgi:hypothetical protein
MGLKPQTKNKRDGGFSPNKEKQMTEKVALTDTQKAAIKEAIAAFIAARASGVEEFHLIGYIFDASNEFTATELKAGRPANQKKLIELVQERQTFSN